LTKLRSALFAIALVGLVLLLPRFGDRASAQSSPNIAHLLSRYGEGDFAAVTAALASIRDFQSALKQLDKAALPWIKSADPHSRARRRLAAAGFALEIAYAGVEKWEDARDFVEWGCVLLRSGGLPQPAERAWHLAAVALSQGARDPDLLINPPLSRPGTVRPIDHLRHATFRFSDEPRLRLARTVTHEFRTLGSDPKHPRPADAARLHDMLNKPVALRQSSAPEVFDAESAATVIKTTRGAQRPVPPPVVRSLQLWLLTDEWKTLTEHQEVRDEAYVRLGNTYLRLGRPQLALAAFENVPADIHDHVLAYLANYLKARAFEASGDRVSALAAYRKALVAAPRAQSASLALATLLFKSDAREEAFTLVADALRPPLSDPWREYQTGDFRFWPEFRTNMRESYK
jgi:tetratricopeptide (TPR) repeat protein